MKRSIRKEKGSIILEFVCVAFLLVAVTLIAVDCAICLFAAWNNDAACRDAVRAAAQQPSPDLARQAAVAAAAEFSGGSLRMTKPVVQFENNQFEYQVYPDAQGVPQRDRGPYVRVTTSAVAKIPAPLSIFGVKMLDEVTFKQSYQFPIVKLPEHV